MNAHFTPAPAPSDADARTTLRHRLGQHLAEDATRSAWRVAAPAATLLVAVLASSVSGQTPDQLASDLKNGPTWGRIHIAEPYPPGSMIVDGDIIVRQPQGGDSYATTFEASNLWPAGQVYYQFDVNVLSSEEATIEQAMADWEAVANVTFVEFPAANHIHIRMSDGDVDPGCNSNVGMVGGTQTMNLTASCLTTFSVHHELGHALGLHHEHQRVDALTYVTINLQNIEAGAAGDLFPPAAFSEDYGPYDFDSVMHYGDYAFSICTPADVTNGVCSTALTTIDVNPPWDTEFQSVIGQRDHLSEWDINTMSFLYPPSDWVFADEDYTGIPTGTFTQPWPGFAVGLVNTPPGGQVIALSPETVSGLGTLDEAITIVAPVGGLILD